MLENTDLNEVADAHADEVSILKEFEKLNLNDKTIEDRAPTEIDTDDQLEGLGLSEALQKMLNRSSPAGTKVSKL